ncbi:MAG: antibiotic biosynthesis monooxygenase [Brachybacterium faecium]|nr:MAG: antibiotic biosynthesis monooxygenase [Brachybacterium faecium]
MNLEEQSIAADHAVSTEEANEAAAQRIAEQGRVDAEVPLHRGLPTDDPLVWTVEEEFVDAASSAAHQDRVAGSTWGRAAAGIQRGYTIDRI